MQRPSGRFPRGVMSRFYRHSVPAGPRVSPCATDISSLRDWGINKNPYWEAPRFYRYAVPTGSQGFTLRYRHTVPTGLGKNHKTHISGGHTPCLPACRSRPVGTGKPICRLLFKPRRGALSVDTTRHPHLFKLRRSGISVPPGATRRRVLKNGAYGTDGTYGIPKTDIRDFSCVLHVPFVPFPEPRQAGGGTGKHQSPANAGD